MPAATTTTVYLTQTQIDKLRKYKAANGGNSKCKLRYRKTRSTPVRFCTGKADHYPVRVSHMGARALAKLMGHAPRTVVYRGRTHTCYTKKKGKKRAAAPPSPPRFSSPPPSPPPLSLDFTSRGGSSGPERPIRRRRRSAVPRAQLPNRGRAHYTETNLLPARARNEKAADRRLSASQEAAYLESMYVNPELRDLMTARTHDKTPAELRAMYTRIFELRGDLVGVDEQDKFEVIERIVADEMAKRQQQ